MPCSNDVTKTQSKNRVTPHPFKLIENSIVLLQRELALLMDGNELPCHHPGWKSRQHLCLCRLPQYIPLALVTHGKKIKARIDGFIWNDVKIQSWFARIFEQLRDIFVTSLYNIGQMLTNVVRVCVTCAFPIDALSLATHTWFKGAVVRGAK